MEYRQKYEDLTLLGQDMDIQTAFDCLSWELAENLFALNAEYCKEKYGSVSDVFVRFPAGKDYDIRIEKLVDLACDFIRLRYAVINETEEFMKQVVGDLLKIRNLMKSQIQQL